MMKSDLKNKKKGGSKFSSILTVIPSRDSNTKTALIGVERRGEDRDLTSLKVIRKGRSVNGQWLAQNS